MIVVDIVVTSPTYPTSDELLTLHNVLDKITDAQQCEDTDSDLQINFQLKLEVANG